MKKAQNLVEVSGILLIVVAVSLMLWPIINNQKMKLTGMSSVNLTSQTQLTSIKTNAIALASSMGLTINSNEDLQTILDKINQAIKDKALAYAKENGIDITGNASIGDILTAIQSSKGTSSAEFANCCV